MPWNNDVMIKEKHKSEMGNEINQLKEQVNADRIEQGRGRVEMSNKNKEALSMLHHKLDTVDRKIQGAAKAQQVEYRLQRREDWLKDLDKVTDSIKEQIAKENTNMEDSIMRIARRIDLPPQAEANNEGPWRSDQGHDTRREERMRKYLEQAGISETNARNELRDAKGVGQEARTMAEDTTAG